MNRPDPREVFHKRVRYKDTTYWLSSIGDGVVVLAPLSHFTTDGELTDIADESFAVIEGGSIMRHHYEIGTTDELVEV